MMYRVIVIVGGALALAACSSSSTPDWMKAPDWNLDAFKPAPVLDTVRFESEPPGAEAKTSNGQSCRTPCALALPLSAPLTVTFSLNGYQPSTERIEPITTIGNPTQFQPNPLVAELTPAAPARPAAKKPPAKKTSAVKPAARPAARANPGAATASAPPPMSASPAPQQAPAPWPSTPPPQR